MITVLLIVNVSVWLEHQIRQKSQHYLDIGNTSEAIAAAAVQKA